MNGSTPTPPSRGEALDEAGEAARGARNTDRDAILEAQRVLRHAEKAHDRAVHDAERRLREHTDDSGDAERVFAAAHADRLGVAEARPLLDRVVGRLETDEEVLDMVAGISAGHDGVMLVTSRRVLFMAPRWSLDVPYGEVEAVKIRGRYFGARATIVAHGKRTVISGLSPVRAAEIGELLVQRVGATR